MKTAIIHGCYNTTNFGDLLLLELIAKYLKDKYQLKSESIRLDSRMTLEYCTQASVKNSLFPDYAIYGGGGYLHDHGEKGAEKTLRYALPAKIWKLLGKKYIIIAPGGGPDAHTKKGAKRLKFLLKNADKLTVRDQITRSFVESLGVNRRDMMVTSDLALTITKEDIPANRFYEISKIKSKSGDKKLIGFHLELIYSNKERFAEFCNLPFFLNKEILNKFHFVFFYDYKTDNLDWIKGKLNSISDLSFYIQERMNHWETVDFLSYLDVVITSKLHVSIVATAFNKPIFGFSFHEKTRRFFEEIGRAKYQKMMTEDISCINEWIQDLNTDNSAAWNQDTQKVDRIKKLAFQNFDVIDKYIQNEKGD